MPDMNDFYAFKSTSGGNSGGGIGCLSPTVVVIVIVIAVLSLIGEVLGI